MSTSIKGDIGAERAETAFLSGKLAQVDIKRIEKELKELWRAASESGEGHLVTRACAMNLILYSEDDDAELRAGDILDQIAIRHPCRAILAINRDSKEDPGKGKQEKLEAWVSARCHLTDSKSRKQICCEQITVLSEGTGTNELASVVLPLVVSDLPVHLWWRTDQLSRAKVEPFLSAIDELIVDSATGSGTGGSSILTELHNLVSSIKSKRLAVVSDLNWRRTYVFREALALAFGQSDGLIPQDAFGDIACVRIKYADCDGTGAESKDRSCLNQSLLYLGWLASRLGWHVEKAQADGHGAADITFSRTGKAVLAEVRQFQCQTELPGPLCSITVDFSTKSVPSIYVSHPKNVPTVKVRYSTNATETWADLRAEAEDANLELSQASESRMIDDELETAEADPAFEPALAVAARILELI